MAARGTWRRWTLTNRNPRGDAWGCLFIPSADDWRAAWAAYRRGEAGSAGIVDHLAFVVMRRLGIARVFTNDQHFAAAGFDILF